MFTAREVRLLCGGLYVMPLEDIAVALGYSVAQLRELLCELDIDSDGVPYPMWNCVEDSVLRSNYFIDGTEWSELLPGRSEKDIQCKCYAMGLLTYDAYHVRWTSDEDEILKRHYGLMGSRVASKLPRRSAAACRARASTLGLRVTVHRRT